MASRDTGPPQAQQSTEANVADWVLPEYDQGTGMVELVIAGAGPSGLAVAERVSQAGGFASPCNCNIYQALTSAPPCNAETDMVCLQATEFVS